jgi:lipopolysaccharide transport system ATP-binding protein
MGMPRHEVARKFTDIVEFAGVAEFIDTPVKRYSSGMNARLGFSIAAHLEPEVLIIDEVLSVGDMGFQQRCIERMRAFKNQGVAIVFVSHNLQAVSELCTRALHLRVSSQAQGATDEVIGSYLGASDRSPTDATDASVTLTAGTLCDRAGVPRPTMAPGVPLTLQVLCDALKPVSDLTFAFVVYRSTDRLVVYDGNIRGREIGVDALTPGQSVNVEFAFTPHFTRGHYFIECAVYHNPTQTYLGRLSPAARLTVDEARTYSGVADVELAATVLAFAEASA